jgi:hypothetical protein
MKRGSSLPALLLSLGGMLLMSGCAGGDELAPAPAPTNTDAAATANVISCLTDRGWDVEAEGETSFRANYAEEQRSAYQADLDYCLNEFVEIRTPDSITDEQWADFYAAEAATAECLREHGVSVPETPSLQSLIDSYTAGESWTAWANVDTSQIDSETLAELQTDYPQPLL